MSSLESEFLTRAADAAFELGASGYRLTSVSVEERALSFTDTGRPPGPPSYVQGDVPVGDRASRRAYDWQPSPEAPAYLHMAWLLADLGEWVSSLGEQQIALAAVEAPEPGWCAVYVRDGDTAHRVLVQLAERSEPLDFPGMFLQDLFSEGRYREYLAPEQGVVDLRGVL